MQGAYRGWEGDGGGEKGLAYDSESELRQVERGGSRRENKKGRIWLIEGGNKLVHQSLPVYEQSEITGRHYLLMPLLIT